MTTPIRDHREKPLTKKQLEIANILRYMDERMLNLVEQIRAVAIAANVSPDEFQKAFADNEAQEKFYIQLQVSEDVYKMKMEKQLGAQDSQLSRGESDKVTEGAT
jgi:hypothetical protein